jgi:UDP-2,3-diacylglucosamine pyrophosphatase LpxH
MSATPAQRKIKVVISDLHLGRGRTIEGGATNPLEEFYFGQKLVEFIHYYRSGEFRDAEVELIINGDFLNFLQVDYHGHYLTVVTEAVSVAKMKSILAGHPEVFEELRLFAAEPGRSISYVVGNHDQCMLWPGTRALFNEVLNTSVKFKNLVYFFDGIHIEHGHMHEAANRFDPKKFFLKKNLPEPILNLPFGSHFFVDFVLKLKQVHPHVDKVRPFKKMIRWAIANEFWFTLTSFFSLTKYFLDAVLIKDVRRQVSLKSILKILAESAIFPDLSEAAHRILNDERIHIVIFGHTHVYQYKQWGVGKEYFNTGTWTDITSLDITSLGKITKLTYVLIEYPEDGGRPRGRLKEWRGYHRIEEDVAVS